MVSTSDKFNGSLSQKMTKSRICYLLSVLSPEASEGCKRGNISGGNEPLRANYGNFNLNHMMLIQGKAYGRWVKDRYGEHERGE
jgi:hypothetical protein